MTVSLVTTIVTCGDVVVVSGHGCDEYDDTVILSMKMMTMG